MSAGSRNIRVLRTILLIKLVTEKTHPQAGQLVIEASHRHL